MPILTMRQRRQANRHALSGLDECDITVRHKYLRLQLSLIRYDCRDDIPRADEFPCMSRLQPNDGSGNRCPNVAFHKLAVDIIDLSINAFEFSRKFDELPVSLQQGLLCSQTRQPSVLASELHFLFRQIDNARSEITFGDRLGVPGFSNSDVGRCLGQFHIIGGTFLR